MGRKEKRRLAPARDWVVNRKQDSSADRLQATALWFGVSQQALSEIEATVGEHLRERALRLGMQDCWPDRVNELLQGRGGYPNPRSLTAYDFAREFGEALHPLFVEVGEEYVEMLTRAIVEHNRQRQPIRWESIAKQAIQFCNTQAAWQHSSEWLVRAFKTAGLETKLFTVLTKVAFETILSGWLLVFRSWDDRQPVTNFFEVARRKITQVVRLTPQSRTLANEQKVESRVPTGIELRNKGAISQRRAAEYLRCDPRTVRNYIQNGELTKTLSGLVVCDDKLTQKLREKFGPALRMK